MSELIYFDNSATTKPLPEVARRVFEQLTSDESFGNPGSLHRLGGAAERVFQRAAEDTARILRCSSEELVFTSCGSESVNTAILGYVRANPRAGKHILSTRTEHMATLSALRLLEQEGYEVTYLPVLADGKIDAALLESSIRNDTALITFTHVNNETGVICDPEDVCRIRNRRNKATRIHFDCVQSLGKLPIRLDRGFVDMASFSGHKIHAPKGVGLLYLRKGIRIKPLILGGGQQRGLRSGTLSPYLAQAFALALSQAEESRESSFAHVMMLREKLVAGLASHRVCCLSPEHALPYVVNVSFPSFESETMLHALEEQDVYVSTVSACSSKKKNLSYVLTEMGIDRKTAGNAIRISFSRFSTEEEVEHFVRIIDNIYEKYSLIKGAT